MNIDISVFDLDKTITKIDCEGLFYKIAFKKKLVKEEVIKRFRGFHNEYKKGKFKHKRHYNFQNKVIKKYKINKKKRFLIYFVRKYISRSLNKKILKKMKKREKEIIISTSSNEFMAKTINEILLGKKNLICTSRKNKKKGLININHGINKVKNIKIWAKKKKIKKFNMEVYTDSINDLPLLKNAKKRWLVNPDKILIKKSKCLENRTILFLK